MFTMKKACVYTRVSTAEQANEGYSIEEQERMCRAGIESKGWEYVGTFSDPGISGRTMNRPGLQEMFDAIKNHQYSQAFFRGLVYLRQYQHLEWP